MRSPGREFSHGEKQALQDGVRWFSPAEPADGGVIGPDARKSDIPGRYLRPAGPPSIHIRRKGVAYAVEAHHPAVNRAA